MRVLLISTYELGHQPLHVASPAAALEAAGDDVRCVDLAMSAWDADVVRWAEAAAFSVPMHTAMRLAMRGAAELRRVRPELPIAFYGLYAIVSRDRVLGSLADALFAGEYESGLVSWVSGLRDGKRERAGGRDLSRQAYRLPVRSGLPPLERYVHLDRYGVCVPAGYVEASRGCAHRCRHCPVPVVYDGRTRKVPADIVVADVEHQVTMGAGHVTFGDPDFLNRWRHALEIVGAVHEAFPNLTYDVTTKVEHLLRYPDVVKELGRTGCVFVVSAFETTNDRILAYLDKGHTATDMSRAVDLVRGHGIEVRPSWLPFTPWTSLQDVVDILDFVWAHDLVGNVDPVQYTIRLLIPEGSLMLDVPELGPHLGPYDDDRLTYTWRAADPRVDELQARLSALVEEDADGGAAGAETYLRIREVVLDAAGEDASTSWERSLIETGSTEGRPRLTEPWFC